jgi:hypothetical protein
MMVMKKGLVTILSAACILSVTGCADNQTDNATNVGLRNNQAPITRVNYNENDPNSNQNATVQTRATKNVERLDEVYQARVIMKGNDAYVTVRLNQNGNNNNNNGTTVGNNSATNSGTTGTNTNLRGMANEYNNVGFNNRNSKIANTADRNNSTELAERINETPGTNNPSTTRPGLGNNTNFTTNVDTNNRNTRTGNSTQVSDQLKQKIENQVRAANKKVNEVFVSVY